MKRKIFFNLCLISIFTGIFSILLTTVVMYNGFFADMKRDVKAEGENLALTLPLDSKSELTKLLAQLRSGENRITYISSNGTVLFDSAALADSMENHVTRPEVKEALNSGIGQAERLSQTLSQKTFYYAIRLKNCNILRTSGTVQSVYSAVFSNIPWMVGTVFLGFILAIFMARYQTGHIVHPINEVDLDHPEQSRVYDELSPLIRKIAKQKQTIRAQMESLRAEQLRFSTITSNMREGLIVVDKNSVVLSCNKSAYKILGSPTAGEKENILTLNRSKVFQNAVDSALNGRRFEEVFTESERQYQLIANSVFDENQVNGAVLLLLDVTEKLERDRLRREFSANVSHELKTPLTSICGSAEILTQGLVKPEDVPRFSGMILDEAKRLIQLVDDVIKLSKLDETTVEKQTEMQPNDLMEITEEVVARLKPLAENAGITLTISGKNAEVMGIKSVLEEIIFNLADNAIKYNRPGGSVKLSINLDKHTITLAVKDNGIGIAKEDQERIFERFYRADKSHSDAVSGTGLGLSIVKHGVQLHGAEIKLKSKLGEGTEIKIIFHQ